MVSLDPVSPYPKKFETLWLWLYNNNKIAKLVLFSTAFYLPRAEFAGVALRALPLHGDRRRRLLPFRDVIGLCLDYLVVVILERDVRMALVEVKLKVA